MVKNSNELASDSEIFLNGTKTITLSLTLLNLSIKRAALDLAITRCSNNL